MYLPKCIILVVSGLVVLTGNDPRCTPSDVSQAETLEQIHQFQI